MTDDTLKQHFVTAIEDFLMVNFPQIQMHGGSATVVDADVETGEVELNLADACDGCGLSPMTIAAIQRRLPQQVAGVTRVSVDTGDPDPTKLPSTDEGGNPF